MRGAGHRIEEIDETNLRIRGICPIMRTPWSLEVPSVLYQRWLDGEFIQDVFPDLGADKRELLISGTSPEGWKTLMVDEDD